MKRLQVVVRKHPVVFAVVCTLAAMLIWAVDLDGDPIGDLDMVATHSATIALSLFLMKTLGLLSGAGFRKKGFWRGLLLGVPFYLLGIASTLYSNGGINLSFTKATDSPSVLLFTLFMLMVGFGEEILFRGLLFNNFLAAWGGGKAATDKAVAVSALVFGAVHLMNMAVAPPLTVLVQSVNAAAAGALFAALYARCRNLWAVAIVHTLVDWLALAPQRLLPEATSIIAGEMTALQALPVVLVGTAVPLFAAWVLLRERDKNSLPPTA